MSYKRSIKKGFTLIELMVVLSVIALMSSIVFASLNGSRKNARDAQRKQTLKQLSAANELYILTNGVYAATVGWMTGWNPGPLVPAYISKISLDPLSPAANYQYWRKDYRSGSYPCMTEGTSYQHGFYAILENPSASDLATISDSFDLCVKSLWNMNYKVGN